MVVPMYMCVISACCVFCVFMNAGTLIFTCIVFENFFASLCTTWATAHVVAIGAGDVFREDVAARPGDISRGFLHARHLAILHIFVHAHAIRHHCQPSVNTESGDILSYLMAASHGAH